MFKIYRELEKGEFFVIGGDCSQGGADYNACAFMSKTKRDFPVVYHQRGVAAQMTSDVFPVLEKIYDQTGIPPVVAFERNMGGASEMERLNVMNRYAKYKLFVMPSIGMVESSESNQLGYSTNASTRPILLGDFKRAIDGRSIKLYDKDTVNELYSFIVGKQGKPQAESNAHDDLIFSHAIAFQLYQQCEAPLNDEDNGSLPDDTQMFNEGFY